MLACSTPSILLQEDSTTSVTLAGTIYFRSIVAKVDTMDDASMCYVYVNVQPVCASSLQIMLQRHTLFVVTIPCLESETLVWVALQ